MKKIVLALTALVLVVAGSSYAATIKGLKDKELKKIEATIPNTVLVGSVVTLPFDDVRTNMYKDQVTFKASNKFSVDEAVLVPKIIYFSGNPNAPAAAEFVNEFGLVTLIKDNKYYIATKGGTALQEFPSEQLGKLTSKQTSNLNTTLSAFLLLNSITAIPFDTLNEYEAVSFSGSNKFSQGEIVLYELDSWFKADKAGALPNPQKLAAFGALIESGPLNLTVQTYAAPESTAEYPKAKIGKITPY